MKVRVVLLAAFMLLASLPTWQSQFQPEARPDWGGYEARADLGDAGALEEPRRVLRFVQVSDAHIIDDDAPEPMRVGTLDGSPTPDPADFSSAERPQEEYTDEVLNAMIASINALHAQDPLDFVINTGDNIDNQLENELVRFIDNWEGTATTKGPVSGMECAPDGQSEDLEDDDNDVTDKCTHLPEAMIGNNTPLAAGLPWFSAFGNHDGLIQGNVPREPSFQEVAEEHGRYFIDQHEYIDLHFAQDKRCVEGVPAGSLVDDFGHGFGFAGERLCDADVDNDGYYSFSSRGVRFIVLDTLNDDFVTGNQNIGGLLDPQEELGYDVLGGYSQGAIDPVQFEWLRGELERNPDQIIVLFSHHTINSMFSDSGSGSCPEQGCIDDLLRQAGYPTKDDIMENLTQYPNVVAWIGGHTHKHRIEAKTWPGAVSPGFWNVETSSLVDMPQQARAIELWMDGEGRGFLRMDRIDHDFDLSRQRAMEDDQVDPQVMAGEAKDQDVLLWFDVPPGVSLVPQPSLPRFLRLDVVTPERVNGTHGRIDEPVAVEILLQDSRTGVGVAGLAMAVDVERSDPDSPVGVVAVNTSAVTDLGDGRYGYSFTPDAPYVHFAQMEISDPTGIYPDLGRVASFDIAGDHDEAGKKGKKSPAAPWPLLGLGLVGLALLRRR